MNIVFASAEVSPFAKTGGLGDVCGALPKAIHQLGHDVTVFTPLYSETKRYFDTHPEELLPVEVAKETLSWGNWSFPMTLFRGLLPGTSIPVIFVANGSLFERESIYAGRHGYDDNLERFAFFCRAVIRGCELLGIHPDIFHAHDWHTSLLPLYLDSGLRSVANFTKTRSVLTIHNLQYQGRFGSDRFGALGLHDRYWRSDALEYYGDVDLMKGGILFADQVTTVSPTYAREVQTSAGGAGLDGLLRDVSFKFRGILNGIDPAEWDPRTDETLSANFEPGKMLGKKICKRLLAHEVGLPFEERIPLIVFISRLVDQKGLDLLIPVISRIAAAGAQLIFLGTGEPRYEEALRRHAEDFPSSIRTFTTFDSPLAHRLIAGADLLLMPSLFEPCGLNQMYALRYGTLPVVRLTGGLADTVGPYDGANRELANGFGFAPPTPEELLRTVEWAITSWRNWRLRKKLQDNGMALDFSWERSAKKYVEVYEEAQRE
jgi:starch synthase